MKSISINLKNMAAMVACFAVFMCATAFTGKTMAQNFNYTDASGVTCTYEPTTYEGIDVVHLTAINSFPSSVTKWVLPVTITQGATTYRVVKIGAYGVWDEYNLKSSSLNEIVLPKYMYHCDAKMSATTFPNLHKITFGEDMRLFPDCTVPFDSIIFMGTGIIRSDGYGGTELYNGFEKCPANTKIIIPCGTMQQFLTAFASSYTTWDEDNGWTTANFVEAPCLKILTVLSSDINLGNAISYGESQTLVTSTITGRTSATFSGEISLVAIPKANTVFTQWSDGNTDNPRKVTVKTDATYTAVFAICRCVANEGAALKASAITVSPNPVQDYLYVNLSEAVKDAALEVFSITGTLVARQTVTGQHEVIPTRSFAKGIYILRLNQAGKVSEGIKIVKQ
jgi:hypothetical protein